MTHSVRRRRGAFGRSTAILAAVGLVLCTFAIEGVAMQSNGPLVVFLPGAETAPAVSDSLERGLGAAGYQVRRVAAAAAGGDAAAAAAVAADIERARSGAAVLVAIGSATAVARRVALEHADRVRGVALLDAPATPTAPPAARERIAAPMYTAGDAALAQDPAAAQRALLAWLRGPTLSSTRIGDRIAAPTDDVLTDAQKPLRQQMKDSLRSAAGARAGVIGPREVLIHDPRLLQGYTAIGDVMASAPLPVNLKELAVIVVARAFDSDYEWYAHARAALGAGIPAEAVEAIRTGREPSLSRADEAIVYDYARQLTSRHKVSDETYHRAWDLLGTQGLLYLTQVIGHYMGVASTLNVHRFTLPPDATPLPPLQR